MDIHLGLLYAFRIDSDNGTPSANFRRIGFSPGKVKVGTTFRNDGKHDIHCFALKSRNVCDFCGDPDAPGGSISGQIAQPVVFPAPNERRIDFFGGPEKLLLVQ